MAEYGVWLLKVCHKQRGTTTIRMRINWMWLVLCIRCVKNNETFIKAASTRVSFHPRPPSVPLSPAFKVKFQWSSSECVWLAFICYFLFSFFFFATSNFETILVYYRKRQYSVGLYQQVNVCSSSGSKSHGQIYFSMEIQCFFRQIFAVIEVEIILQIWVIVALGHN